MIALSNGIPVKIRESGSHICDHPKVSAHIRAQNAVNHHLPDTPGLVLAHACEDIVFLGLQKFECESRVMILQD